jgi:acetoin utilization protein AcuB
MSRPTPAIAAFMTSSPHSIGRDQSLAAAHRMMREHRIRHLPVLEAGKLVGVISDRDLHLAETLKDVDAERVPVEDAMTPTPYAVAPTTPVAEVAREMAEQKIGSAVVMEGRKIVGVFTVTDALRALARYAEGEVDAPPAPAKRAPKPAPKPAAKAPARAAKATKRAGAARSTP